MSTQSRTLVNEGPADDETIENDPGTSAAWSSDHSVNLRLSLPLFSNRYYVTLIAGKERRSPTRVQTEAAKHPVATRGNTLLLACLGTFAGLVIWALLQIFSVLVLKNLGMVVGGG